LVCISLSLSLCLSRTLTHTHRHTHTHTLSLTLSLSFSLDHEYDCPLIRTADSTPNRRKILTPMRDNQTPLILQHTLIAHRDCRQAQRRLMDRRFCNCFQRRQTGGSPPHLLQRFPARMAPCPQQPQQSVLSTIFTCCTLCHRNRLASLPRRFCHI
jgi:hypothetical protein